MNLLDTLQTNALSEKYRNMSTGGLDERVRKRKEKMSEWLQIYL